jgi:hypothetical protein
VRGAHLDAGDLGKSVPISLAVGGLILSGTGDTKAEIFESYSRGKKTDLPMDSHTTLPLHKSAELFHLLNSSERQKNRQQCVVINQYVN